MNKNEDIKHARSMQILLIQFEICHIFHYHVNIILKLMVEFVTELVEIVHFFSIVTNFSVQAMRSSRNVQCYDFFNVNFVFIIEQYVMKRRQKDSVFSAKN